MQPLTPKPSPARGEGSNRRTLVVLVGAGRRRLAGGGLWHLLRGRQAVEAPGASAGKHYAPVAGIRNVLFISIDTCRADRLSCYGYRHASTPNVDAVARDGVLFQRAWCRCP